MNMTEDQEQADELDPVQEAERERQSVALFSGLAQSLARYADTHQGQEPKRR
jgi:hypothetical protein